MKMKRPSLSRVITYVVLCLWGLTTIYPFLWVILNSFRKKGLILSDSFSLPVGDAFTWENYLTAWERSDFKNAYLNSFVISGSVTIMVVLLAGLAAYGLVRYRFRLRKLLYGLIMAGMMFPVFSTIIPVFKMMVEWGLLNKSIAVILPQIAGNLSFATIVMTGFMQSIPLEMEEAAYMEGADVFKVFGKIIVPLCRPSLATVAIFSFLWSYNDLFVQKIMMRDPTKYPISTLLEQISSQYGTDFGLMAASVTIIVIPVMIVYVLLQKNIIKGLTAGAVKG